MRNLIPDHIRRLPKRSAGSPASPVEIRLDRNEQPFPPSPRVVQAIRDAAMTANRYPGTGSVELRAKLADYLQVPAGQIVVGNGSDEVIEWIARAFLTNCDEVIIPAPSFFYYSTATEAVGGVPVYVKRGAGFTLDHEAIFTAVTPRTKVLYLANPNNPTGTPIPRSEIISILDRADFLVVVDECYFEFHGHTVLDLLGKYPHLIVMRSFSKAFGLAGLRVGYGIASVELCDYLTRVAQSFSVNRMAQAAAVAALDDHQYAQVKIAQACRDRDQLASALTKLGYLVMPSQTNFLLARTTSRSSASLVSQLKEDHQIYLADFGYYQGLEDGWFRVSVGQPNENGQLLSALATL
jgi:histidinol-phosphate aminotransferase